ncbi:MAG TPA: type IX secretion system membrane protein PorP/SprF [Fluviicola sp.]|nr:type IX secretion system membrane protein PorP/SprF [Fluviicola sp.]
MKTTINIVLTVLCIGSGSTLQAQQNPMFTHYMYNTLSVNPAYAGSREALSITAIHRSQWVGFSGAPMTQTLTLHSPIFNKHIGLGLTAMNDKIGPVNTTGVSGAFAYIMQLTERSKLALGVSGGVNILQADLTSVALDDPDDPTYLNNTRNRTTPNFGVGAYYSRDRFYAGISVPNLVESDLSSVENVDGVALVGKATRHYFFIAGAMFRLTDNLGFLPTTLVKATAGAPLQVDVTASFVIHRKLSLGAMYRTGDAFGALIGFDISEQFRISYSFDWSYGVRTAQYNSGSHEIMLRYEFIYPGKKQIRSPRYF